MSAPPLDTNAAADLDGELCIANAQLVLPDRVLQGRLHVSDGWITELVEGDEVPRGAVDADGDYLIPGLIELHTDNLERHIEPRPKIEMPHISAILAHDGEVAACGITTVFDALRVGSVMEASTNHGKYARSVADEILGLQRADALRARHLIHLRAETCSDTLIEEFKEFDETDGVGLVSLMDHTPGQRQFRDLAKLRQYLSAKYAFDDETFAAHVARQRDRRARLGAQHETATVAAAQRLGAVLASHDDTTLDQVAHSRNLGISLAEFPTTSEAAQACRETGMRIIMGAPNLIRGGSHSGNISASDLARDGLLDIMSSDYVPALLLSSAWKLSRIWNDLPRAVGTVTQAPAAAVQLSDRGSVAPDKRADLVRVRMLDETPVVRTVWRGGIQIA